MTKYSFLLFIMTFTSAIFAQSINWVDAERAFTMVQGGNKLVFIFFMQDDCELCEEMEKHSFKDEKVIKFMREHFIAAKVNPERNGGRIKVKNFVYDFKKFTYTSKIYSFPSYGFYYSTGTMIQSARGFSDAESLLSLMKYIVENVKK